MSSTNRETSTIKQLEEKLGKKIAMALASAFLDDTKDTATRLKQCVAKKDAASLRLITHKLAGCSASIMDKETHALCRTLEDQGDERSWEETERTFKALVQSLTETREALTKYVKE